MPERYTIHYSAENTYEYPVIEAFWQFLIIPEVNASQGPPEIRFTNSADVPWELSVNGFDFPVIRLRNRHAIERIHFEAEFRLLKQGVNPFDFNPSELQATENLSLDDNVFRINFSTFLHPTPLTHLPEKPVIFQFDPKANLMDNLQALNEWVYQDLKYTPGLTHVDTTLQEVLKMRKGVCQDYAHLFVAICRTQGVPARYVSGYLHQGMGFLGDAQMHAWAEAWIPKLGWTAFDPTNNILAASDHVKVAHGRDYSDCAPLKGVLFGPGGNTSRHSVEVQSQQ